GYASPTRCDRGDENRGQASEYRVAGQDDDRAALVTGYVGKPDVAAARLGRHHSLSQGRSDHTAGSTSRMTSSPCGVVAYPSAWMRSSSTAISAMRAGMRTSETLWQQVSSLAGGRG